jgi:hypothetical protein
VGAGSEVLVPSAPATAFSDDDGLIGASEVVDQLTRGVVVEQRTDGNFEGGAFPGVTRAVGAEAVPAALCLVLGVVAEMDQCVVAQRGGHQYVAAMAAVSAGGAPLGDELFATERHTAIAAVSGLDSNSCFINKHATSSVPEARYRCRIRGQTPM